jgi:hypothetical protein
MEWRALNDLSRAIYTKFGVHPLKPRRIVAEGGNPGRTAMNRLGRFELLRACTDKFEPMSGFGRIVLQKSFCTQDQKF